MKVFIINETLIITTNISDLFNAAKSSKANFKQIRITIGTHHATHEHELHDTYQR